jgi:hypothetical protein
LLFLRPEEQEKPTEYLQIEQQGTTQRDILISFLESESHAKMPNEHS